MGHLARDSGLLTDDFEARRTSFGAAAELYDRMRPTYPPEAVRWALGEVPLRVLDIGAGTGKLSRVVAGLGHEVVAVEPDDGMRAILAARTPGIAVLAGRAEEIPLDDASVDAFVAGQAFHWFDNDAARAELARVVRPGGWAVKIANFRDERLEWVVELGRAAHFAAEGTRALRDGDGDDPSFGAEFGPFETRRFEHTARHTPETLVELIHSRSNYLVASAGERQAIDDAVLAIGRAQGASFELPYVAVVWRARRR